MKSARVRLEGIVGFVSVVVSIDYIVWMPSSSQLKPRFRVMTDQTCALGLGKTDLLRLIAKTGSISKAEGEDSGDRSTIGSVKGRFYSQ